MKFIKRLILFVLILIIVVGSVVILNGYNLYKTTINEKSLSDKISQIKSDKK